MRGQLETEPAPGSGPVEACSRGGTETLGVAFGGICS
jgi:hypothetical protein